MQGDEGDQGTWIFHSTELVGLILTGGTASVPTPEQLGPRKAGQVGTAARVVPHTKVAAITQRTTWFLIIYGRVRRTLRQGTDPDNFKRTRAGTSRLQLFTFLLRTLPLAA